MAKIVVSQFISLDGVVEDPGGSEDFEHGGWAFKYERGAEGDRFKLDEVMSADALLLGRTTYEGFAEAWPSREGEFADKFNGMPKYVVSATLERSRVEQLARDLGRRPGGRGGRGSGPRPAATSSSTAASSWCGRWSRRTSWTRYRLMVYPVLLGKGKRLFGETGEPRSLRLTSSQPAGETTILIYEPAGS